MGNSSAWSLMLSAANFVPHFQRAMHRLASSVSLWQLGLFRSIGGISLALCLAWPVGWAVFRTHHPILQLVRAAVIVAYAWVLIYSLTVMPFANATAIGYTQAVYVAFLAPPKSR